MRKELPGYPVYRLKMGLPRRYTPRNDGGMDSCFRRNDIIPNVIANDRRECGNPVNAPEQVSREKALEAIKLIQDNLSACISPVLSGKRTRARENVGVG